MAELRETHLPKSGANKKVRRPDEIYAYSAMQKLQAAYEAELARKKTVANHQHQIRIAGSA